MMSIMTMLRSAVASTGSMSRIPFLARIGRTDAVRAAPNA